MSLQICTAIDSMLHTMLRGFMNRASVVTGQVWRFFVLGNEARRRLNSSTSTIADGQLERGWLLDICNEGQGEVEAVTQEEASKIDAFLAPHRKLADDVRPT